METSQGSLAGPRRGRAWVSVALAASLLLGAILTVPGHVSAAPQVLPVSSSLVAVTDSDTITMRNCSLLTIGFTYTLRAPDGNQMSFACNSTVNGPDLHVYSLNGTRLSGGEMSVIGNLVGSPADGTWQLTYSPPVGLCGYILPLMVGGKSWRDTKTELETTTTALWNWRNTAANGTFDQFRSPCASAEPRPAVAENDPNNAVFFQDAVGPVVSPFTAYTLHATVSCTAVPTMTINGAWLGGNSTLFSRYAYRDGNFLGETDLRIIFGTNTTTAENEGNTSNGTDADSGVSYNNAAGTSYQFIVNTTPQGEALGAVAFAPPGQCTPAAIGIAGLTLGADQFHLEVSNAQCANDAVSFALEFDILFNVLTEDMDVQIYDSNNGSLIATYDDSQMFPLPGTGDPRLFHFADVFPPGAYVAVGRVDQVLGTDYYESKAFNVPRGSCVDSPTDLTPVLIAINSTAGNLNASIQDTANQTRQLILSVWSDYNATEAENLALILGNQNITLAQLLAFWADYNATAIQDTAAIIQNITTTASHHEAHFHEYWDQFNSTDFTDDELIDAFWAWYNATSNSAAANFTAYWTDYNATEAANYAGLIQFMQLYWTDYNATEAANLAILWSEHNITQATLVEFWADHNATALSDTTTILAAIASHDSNMTAQHNIISADLDTIYQAIQDIEFNVTCTGEGACNFSIDQETIDNINYTVSTLLAEELNMTAFERVTGLTGLEFAVFPALVLLGIIIWLRSTDYVIRTLGALLVILSGLVWMAVAYYVGFGLVWAGTVPSGIVLMLVGIYMIIRQGWEAFQDARSIA